jgi:hypothetical protein
MACSIRVSGHTRIEIAQPTVLKTYQYRFLGERTATIRCDNLSRLANIERIRKKRKEETYARFSAQAQTT